MFVTNLFKGQLRLLIAMIQLIKNTNRLKLANAYSDGWKWH